MFRRIGSDVIGSFFWIGVGIFFAIEGIRLNVGTFKNPGPGFLPLIMAMLLILFSLSIFVMGLTKSRTPLSNIFWKRQFIAVASVFLYIFLLEFVDFLLSTFVLMCILFGTLLKERNKWIKVPLYSAVVAVATWLIFYVAIRVPFPFPRFISIWS